MFSSLVSLLVLLVVRVPFTLGLGDIKVGAVILAGSNVGVTISNDLNEGSRSEDAKYNYFRVYLTINVPSQEPKPSCYLLSSSSIDSTNFQVNIPASVGPSDSQYSIAIMAFNENPENPAQSKIPSDYEYSNLFYFQGGSSMYSEYELDGYEIGDADSIPCSAYDCTRQCAQKYFPDDMLSDNGYKKDVECINKCPGVSFQPSDVGTWNSTSFNATISSESNRDKTKISSSAYNSSTATLLSTTTKFPEASIAAATSSFYSSAAPSASSTAATTPPILKSSAKNSIPSVVMMEITIFAVVMAQILR